MWKFFALACVAVVFAQNLNDGGDIPDIDLKPMFEAWMTKFNVTYTSQEAEAKAFNTWVSNSRRIAAFNKANNATYTLAMNQFGDLTSDEFRLRVHGSNGNCLNGPVTAANKMEHESVDAPSAVDWATARCGSGACVTPVKNQGQCGSCWSFSTTGAIESAHAIKNNQLISLSEQQLVDCSTSFGNEGCNGGLMDNAFKYVESSGGLCTESAYPYKAAQGTCRASSCGTKYDPISGYHDVVHDSSSSLMNAVASQPVSIAVQANQFAFQFYSGGVLSGNCGTQLDHGVLAVGYGTMQGQDYWKVKNSWGASWGMQGYLLICRDCNKNHGAGECGILEEPSFPDAQ